MPTYGYLIIGSGMTADAAIHGIREVDQNGSIGVIGSESYPPVQSAAPDQGALERQTAFEHLAQDRQSGDHLPSRSNCAAFGFSQQTN